MANWRRLYLFLEFMHLLINGSLEVTVTVVIDGYTINSTKSSPASLPLGTALVLVCRVSGIPQGQIKYNWTCPDGPCERPGYMGRKVVNGNILAVNITSDSDGGTYTCEVSRDEANGGYHQDYTLLVTKGNLIHSYGRLIHSQHIITRVDQVLPSGYTTGIGRMDCTRTKPEPVAIVLNGASIGTDPAKDPVYRSIENDSRQDTIFFNQSYMDNFNITGGYCTNEPNSYFYLALSPGTLFNVVVIKVLWHKVAINYDVFIGLSSVPPRINKLIIGYERHDLGVTLQGKYTKIQRQTRHIFRGLVPGAHYTVVIIGLGGTSTLEWSKNITRRSFRTKTAKPSPPRHLSVVGENGDGIQLNWIPPLKPNGNVYYLIEYDNVIVNTEKSTYFNLTGLQGGMAYNFTVVAVNSAGRSGAVLNYRHKQESPGSPEVTVVIDGYTVDSVQSSPATLPLGTALVLVCRVSGIPQRQIKYNWTCPDGPCERPGYAGRRVVNGNILSVNITSDSDGGTYTCEVSRDETNGGYSQNYTLLVTRGNFIHSYGRLVHYQRVITRRELLLPPDDIRGPGKLECTRNKVVTQFALHTGTGRNPADQFYRNVKNDNERDNLQFQISNLNEFQNTEGFCNKKSTTYFYLFLLPGKSSPVNISHTFTAPERITINLNPIPSEITKVIVGYERHDLGVTLQGEYANIGKSMQHTFSSLVPGARYTVVVQGLNGTSDRSQYITRRDIKTMGAKPSPPRHPCVIGESGDGIELNWIPPLEPNGDVFYLIINEYYEGNKTINTSSGSTSFNLVGLQRGVTYNLTVVAVNSEGKSDTGAVLNFKFSGSTHLATFSNDDRTVLLPMVLVSLAVLIISLGAILSCLMLYVRREYKWLHRKTAYAYSEGFGSSVVKNEWEMKHSDLEIQGPLGKGEFGDVMLAFLTSTTCTDRVKSYTDRMVMQGDSLSTSKTVAVKFLRRGIAPEEMHAFFQEIELMKRVSVTRNIHIVQIIGCVMNEPPIAMVMEYVPFGDLHSNLVQWKEQLTTAPISLQESDIWSFARQIAVGMTSLSLMNIVHRDLACRNILVGHNKLLKISDFGLSKNIDGPYTSSSNTRLPVRWMAPESISHRIFSNKSDVWSYGVCLWEICTLGELPYGCIPNSEVSRTVTAGVLLERPQTCSSEIYDLMLNCWKMPSKERPTFNKIKKYLENCIESNMSSTHYITLDDIVNGHPTSTTETSIMTEVIADENEDTFGLNVLFKLQA